MFGLSLCDYILSDRSTLPNGSACRLHNETPKYLPLSNLLQNRSKRQTAVPDGVTFTDGSKHGVITKCD